MELAEAAADAIAKIEAVIPERLRGYMADTALLAPPIHFMEPIGFDLADLRRAVRSQRKVHFGYTDVLARRSERTVRPLSLAYFGPVWILAAWCELREDFRTFRLDRMEGFVATPRALPAGAGQDAARFPEAHKHLDARRARDGRGGAVVLPPFSRTPRRVDGHV